MNIRDDDEQNKKLVQYNDDGLQLSRQHFKFIAISFLSIRPLIIIT
jgi:hypothetical protein